MEKNHKEAGYMMLDVALLSILLLFLAGNIYFLELNSQNLYLFENQINAEYIAQYYLDEIILINDADIDKDIERNGVIFHITTENTNSGNFRKVVVSWKINGIQHQLSEKRMYLP